MHVNPFLLLLLDEISPVKSRPVIGDPAIPFIILIVIGHDHDQFQ